VIAAGLTPGEAFDVSWTYVYDDDALVRSPLSAAGVEGAAGDREPEVRDASIDASKDAWHVLVAGA